MHHALVHRDIAYRAAVSRDRHVVFTKYNSNLLVHFRIVFAIYVDETASLPTLPKRFINDIKVKR